MRKGQTSPEMLYLETKWASLIPFARAADLLKEVLPVGDLVNAETVRNHLQPTAERIEQELGEERQLNRFEGSEQEWERQPLPDGPITVAPMKKLTLKEEFRYAILSAIHDEGLDISDAIDSAFEAVIQPVLGSYPDEKANAKRVESGSSRRPEARAGQNLRPGEDATSTPANKKRRRTWLKSEAS
jgi:hypothetical protein